MQDIVHTLVGLWDGSTRLHMSLNMAQDIQWNSDDARGLIETVLVEENLENYGCGELSMLAKGRGYNSKVEILVQPRKEQEGK